MIPETHILPGPRQHLPRRSSARMAVASLALVLSGAAFPALAQQAPGDAPAAHGHHAMMKDGMKHPPMARLTVSGMGKSSATPDLATISLGVTVQADTASEAMSENATRQTAVIEKLKEQGIETRDIQTSGLSLSPVQNYTNDSKPPVITGYMAQNMVTIRVRDLSKLGTVLDNLVAAGANEINGINFSREDLAEAEDQARAAAVDQARHRAEVMAEAAGMRLGPLMALADQSADNGPRPMMMAMAANAKSDATPIEAGELEVSASVNATFAMLPKDDGAAPDTEANPDEAPSEAPAAE